MKSVPQTATNIPSSITLRHLLEDHLRDLFDAEVNYSKFLARVGNSIEHKDLMDCLRFISITNCEQIEILEELCTTLGVPSTGVHCAAMEGLIREAYGTTREYESGAVRDAGLIANAQRIVHYEIAGFGTTKAFAKKLNLPDVEQACSEMLGNAVRADKNLTKIADGTWLSEGINDLAVEHSSK